MKKKITMIVFAFSVCVAASAQQAKPTLMTEEPAAGEFKFEENTFDFGKVMQGDSVYHEFTFTNVGKEPIVIESTQVTCGCTVPDFPHYPIKPGAKGVIKVLFHTQGKMGTQDKTVTIVSKAKPAPMVIHLKGTVEVPPAKDPSKN